VTMHVIDTYVGNRSEGDVTDRLEGGDHESVTVGDDERRRSRFRTSTEAGTDVGVVVDRELRSGDVLAGDGLTVVVELEPVEALVVDLAGAEGLPAAVRLGHAAGNRHWSLAVRGDQALFPVTDSSERMLSALEASLPAGASVATEAVPPSTFDGARETAAGEGGGGGRQGHGRKQDRGHEHGHDHEHGHGHNHGHEHEHGHGHGDGRGRDGR
jgi:urease accessory protein